MKKICVVTATRAEYGLLKPIIKKLMLVQEFDVHVVATGAHLSSEFGFTYQEIEKDGISIDEKIEILLDTDTPSAISKSMALAMIGFASYFERMKPNNVIVLGDRYETLAICIAAMNERIPITHLYGGEITEGAIDDSIRHAITKLSYLHFTSTEEYRNRVIQLGEQPDRVFCVGAIGIENILNETLLTKAELQEAINFSLERNYAMITFHPVTLENNSAHDQFQALLQACRKHSELKYIFTKANADTNGRIINQMIDEFIVQNENAIAFSSMGVTRYLSALKYCSMVIGNSSSGLLEAPSFRIPTINIGDRQKGRLQASSIINCSPLENEIAETMDMALSEEFQHIVVNTINPYGDGNTSDKIIRELKTFFSKPANLKKKFYDCKVI
ncbi:GDP/UDP-N,N'-diacetylbacillosamine 2-epimerase (hydrolysing) [Anaerocolumna jejuensis DSM 15929]|uniref:GDP/UDP-N,N'-diacetylbacillosamine 2-epimerase (Hydrolysing) n=1 Tax=Anaerocolumna jejuensis DSM 15929 TaxID=1121322 RepID=A0A1M7B447_9FIRM|nr:UDP-N-acetylglucosamine 2-epimerase [Anaerocolumna jejuensis]SHL49785.1 GDP/UDP-N,N'-diacetylbacillosamine 2-epimerase (hydrolysing) [Anaerocolumna jejuensis DSM 15929]